MCYQTTQRELAYVGADWLKGSRQQTYVFHAEVLVASILTERSGCLQHPFEWSDLWYRFLLLLLLLRIFAGGVRGTLITTCQLQLDRRS